MKYRVLKAYSIDELQTLVKIYLGKGWGLQGGVCVFQSCKSPSIIFYQAMTKTAS